MAMPVTTSTAAVVAFAVVVGDGQQVHPVQLAGEEQAEQDQAQRRAERIGNQPAEVLVQEGGGNAEHGFGAEPGREHHRHDHDQRQRAAGGNVVARVVHLGGGIHADADGNDQIEDDETQQHGLISRTNSTQFDFRPDAVQHAALLAVQVAQHFQASQVAGGGKTARLAAILRIDVAHRGAVGLPEPIRLVSSAEFSPSQHEVDEAVRQVRLRGRSCAAPSNPAPAPRLPSAS